MKNIVWNVYRKAVSALNSSVVNSPLNDHHISLCHTGEYFQNVCFYICLQGSVNFKFGVLYAKDGQLTDDEMFSNGEHRRTFNNNLQYVSYFMKSLHTYKTYLWSLIFYVWTIFTETGSENFDKFLNLLGDTICLQGWAGYRGGLDTKSKTTLIILETN